MVYMTFSILLTWSLLSSLAVVVVALQLENANVKGHKNVRRMAPLFIIWSIWVERERQTNKVDFENVPFSIKSLKSLPVSLSLSLSCWREWNCLHMHNFLLVFLYRAGNNEGWFGYMCMDDNLFFLFLPLVCYTSSTGAPGCILYYFGSLNGPLSFIY